MKSIRSDTNGQIGLFIMVTPYIIIFIGMILAFTGSLGLGLVIMGFGILLLGTGGMGSIAYGSIRVTGPVGFLLVIVGAVIMYYF